MANIFQSVLNYFNSKNVTNDTNLTVGRIAEINKASIAQASNPSNPDFKLKEAEKISTVYACLRILSDNISRLPLNVLYDDGKTKTLATDHRYYKSLKYNPTVWQTYQTWISTVIVHLYLRGNAYCAINPDGTLEIIHPDLIDDVDMFAGELWYYSKALDKIFNYKQILHFKLLSKDGLRGLSPIKSMANEIQIYYKSTKTIENNYSQGSNSKIYLKPVTDQFSNPKIKELIEEFQKNSGGYQNAGLAGVIPLLHDLQVVTIPREDVAILESTKFSEATICSVMQVPVWMIRPDVNMPFNTFEQARLNFVNNVLGSVINILEASLNDRLLTTDERDQGYRIEFDKKVLFDVDFNTKANVYKTLASMAVVSPNETRRAFGLDALPEENASYHYTQMQMIPIEKIDYENYKPVMPISTKTE